MAEMRPYYSDAAVTIYHGDCREVGALELQADAVIADPPYNVGITYGDGTNDNREDYEEWTREWFDAVRTVAWKTVVFPGHGNLAMWFASFKPSAVGCWYKTNGGGKSLLGVNQWEPWLYWCGDQGALGGSDVIRSWVGVQTGNAQSSHPTVKPVDLMQGLIKKLRCEIVLDPFMGSGSTLVAAKNLGRKAIGIEIEERYCELSADRCSQYALQLEG